MRKFIVTLALLLVPSTVFAGSYGKYGLGVFESAAYSRVAVKTFSLGYEEDWFGPFIHQYEVGMFSDTSGHGRSSTGFGFMSVGVEVNPGYLVVRSLWGIGAITTPDTMLGGWFQFTQDLLLGVRDNKGNMIGLDYKHISSAGIYPINRGRDLLTVQVEIPW